MRVAGPREAAGRQLLVVSCGLRVDGRQWGASEAEEPLTMGSGEACAVSKRQSLSVSTGPTAGRSAGHQPTAAAA